MAVIEQRRTDLVEITDLGDNISLLTFAWDSNPNGVSAFYAHSDQVADELAEAAEAGEPPVSWLAKNVDQYFAFRKDPNVPDVLNDIPFEVADDRYSWRTRGGLPSLTVVEAGYPVTPADLYRYDSYNDTLYSFVTEAPVARPLLMRASAADWNLDALAALLDAHPWVGRIFYDRGLPGEDHVPPSLQMFVKVPQEHVTALFKAGESVTAHALEKALFVLPGIEGAVGALGVDPLGIAAARRDGDYPYPDGCERFYGEVYSALEDRYPDVREIEQL